MTHQTKSKFENEPRPRVSLPDIQASAEFYQAQGEKRPILLCFVADPYQPIEAESELTRQTIAILKAHGLRVTILTKGGRRAMRDFDLLVPGEDAFATTLTLTNADESIHWEPDAALPGERIYSIHEAHAMGLETWVSFEPVIRPSDVIHLLDQTRGFVGHYKVGTMNYHPHAKKIDWFKFGWLIKGIMDKMGVRYYLKDDLRRAMTYAGPAWGGPV